MHKSKKKKKKLLKLYKKPEALVMYCEARLIALWIAIV